MCLSDLFLDKESFSIAKTYIYLGILLDAAVSTELCLAFVWCPCSRQVTRPDFLPQPDTSFQNKSLLQIVTWIPYMLSWASVSIQLVGRCQTLAYVKPCRYVRLLGHSSSSTEQILGQLCSIITRQLELLLWRARSDSPTSSCQCLPHGFTEP